MATFKWRLAMAAPACAVLMLLAGCEPIISLHPAYTDSDLVFDRQLLGNWTREEEVWTFRAGKGNSYELTIVEKPDDAQQPPQRTEMEAHLFRIPAGLFWDVYPKGKYAANGLYEALLVPGHVFARLSVEGEQVRLSPLGSGWLKKQLANDKQFAREIVTDPGGDSHLVLTAPTHRLQEFLARYAGEEKAYEETFVLKRGAM